MTEPAIVRELVDRFPSADSPSFQNLSEEDVRAAFINPLFEALGWGYFEYAWHLSTVS